MAKSTNTVAYQMTTDQALEALTAVGDSMHGSYGAHHSGRLEQLDAALRTASMAVRALADEQAREVDLAQRIVNRDKVHGDETRSPVNRPFEETRSIAAEGSK